jgi:hypothetical protein
MRVVYKYPIPSSGEHTFDLALPLGAQILHADVQEGRPMLWALVTYDQDVPVVLRSFVVVETGTPIRHVVKAHVGTLLFERGSYVLHVFEISGG